MANRWVVRVLLKGARRRKMLGSDGYLTRLLVHAIQYDTEEAAAAAAAHLMRLNPKTVEHAEAGKA